MQHGVCHLWHTPCGNCYLFGNCLHLAFGMLDKKGSVVDKERMQAACLTQALSDLK